MANNIIIYPSGSTLTSNPFTVFEDTLGAQLIMVTTSAGTITFSSSTDSSRATIGTDSVSTDGYNLDNGLGTGVYIQTGASYTNNVQVISGA